MYEDIVNTYPLAAIVEDSEQVNALLKKHNTKTYVYIMVVDDQVLILGEGTGARGFVILPNRAAPAHLKAITAALGHHVYDDVVRIFIPTESKEESLEIERELFTTYDFHSISVDDKNTKLLEMREAQLGIELDQATRVALMPLLYATGTDMGTFKKYRKHLAPEINKAITDIFGGYYKDM